MFWCYSGLDKDGFEKKFINNEIGKNIFSWSHSLTQFSMRMSMSVEISKFIGVLCWLIIYGFMSNPAQEYFSYIEMSVSHHHCWWKAAQFRPMLGAQDLWAGIEGSLSCHTYCDTVPQFFWPHPKNRPIQSPLTTHELLQFEYRYQASLAKNRVCMICWTFQIKKKNQTFRPNFLYDFCMVFFLSLVFAHLWIYDCPLYVCKDLHFLLLLQNQPAIFNKTYHELSLCKGNSNWYKWRSWPLRYKTFILVVSSRPSV